MSILCYIAKPATVAEIVRASGLPHPEVVAELRRLGRRVEEIKPTTIHDRAIRYRATNDAHPTRDLARAPKHPERRDADRHPDPAPVSVDLAGVGAGDVGQDDRDDRGREAVRAHADRIKRAPYVCRPVGSDEVVRIVRESAIIGRRASVVAVLADVRREAPGATLPQVSEAIRTVLGEGRVRRQKTATTPRVMVWAAPASVPWTQRGRLTVNRALAFLVERGQATRAQIRDGIDVCDSRARLLIQKMRAAGLIAPMHRENGNAPAIWRAVGPA